LVAAVHAAEAQVDAPEARSFEAATADLAKILERVEGTLKALRQAAATLTAALATLAAEPDLAAGAVYVPRDATTWSPAGGA
jgi:hypothetical protein